MVIDIKVLQFFEFVVDGIVVIWYKKEGEVVKCDELLVDIEIDKVVLEVVVFSDGVVVKIIKDEGDIVESQEVLGQLEVGSGVGGVDKGDGKDEVKDVVKDSGDDDKGEEKEVFVVDDKGMLEKDEQGGDKDVQVGFVVCKMMSEYNFFVFDVKGSGCDGCIIKEDVEKVLVSCEECKQFFGGEVKNDVFKVVLILVLELGEWEECCVLMICLCKCIVECLVFV